MSKRKWDVNRAYRLWMGGVRVEEIAHNLGVSRRAIQKAGVAHDWPKRRPVRGRLVATEKPVVRRCDRCLGQFKEPHTCNRPLQSIYEAAA